MAGTPPLSAPPLPAYRATWRAIYYEPVSGSGERWTVGVAVADAEGQEIRDTLSPSILGSLRELTHEAQSDAISLVPVHSDAEATEKLIRFAA